MIPAANGPVAGEERERRRRDDADDVDVDAEAGRAGGDGRHEHVARPARVLADDDRAARARPADGRRAPERVGERRLEVDVGDTADPVGAEQAGHRSAAARRREGVTTRPATRDGDGGRGDRDLDRRRAGRHERRARPAGRPSPAPSVVPGVEAAHVEVRDEGRALEPVEVRRRTRRWSRRTRSTDSA